MGNLSSTCCKIGHGHPRAKICIYVVQLHIQKFHAKFQNRRPSGSTEADFYFYFAIYSHGSHLIYILLFSFRKDAVYEIWL